MLLELIAVNVQGQEFCVNVHDVREIRGWTAEARIPNAPGYVRGMVNLRGAVLPIMDLGLRLGFAPAEPSARHAILVVEVDSAVVGLLVDAVSEIFTAQDTDIQNVPSAATEGARELVSGIIPSGNRLISLINVAKLVPEMADAA
ncbi:MAG TPA: chemotaxis protein CheW [Roseiarcus sp.]|nr:chemotaxis protein CheW [Roseiarcus sp.]